MAEIATPEFLSRMRSLYPKQPGSENGRWAMIVAIAFCASNLPEAVPLVFQYAVKDYTSHDDQLYLVRKIKDSLLKSAMLSGFPKVCWRYLPQMVVTVLCWFLGYQCTCRAEHRPT